MTVNDELYQYALGLRRQLHQYPEVGFEVDRTVELIDNELTSLGIEGSHMFGKGSVVADIGRGDRLVALRADIDALPIDEDTGLEFRSKRQGYMHACGHDSHTAILLAVAKHLKENEDKLHCRVRLIFQPSEECEVSGAKMLVDNGVMDGVSEIVATHCENEIDTGTLGVCSGDYMAACVPLNIRFYGRTSHATLPQYGIDANAMAVEAYVELKRAVETLGVRYPHIWSVGRISGGQVHNVISDYCEMSISFRFYDNAFADTVETKTREICQSIAEKYGGAAELDWKVSTYAVHNDEALVTRFESVCRDQGSDVVKLPSRMSSEDFAWYLTKAPGLIFRFGTRNEEKGCTQLAHRSDFNIDEEGMRYAISAFCTYILTE